MNRGAAAQKKNTILTGMLSARGYAAAKACNTDSGAEASKAACSGKRPDGSG